MGLGVSPPETGKELTQAERMLLGQGTSMGPMAASFMGFGELGRSALLAAVPPTGVADRMLIELKDQTNLLRVIAGMGPATGMEP
jgi:hypothetical protein